MNKKKKSIWDDKRVSIVAAMLIAVLAWIIVAGFIMPGDSRKLTNVSIEYSRGENALQERGLQIVSHQPELYADVLVKGEGAQIGPLSNASVSVYPDYSQYTEPGTYEVPLRVTKVSTATFTIDSVSVRGGGYSLDNKPKDTVTVTFEEVTTKTFTITARAEGVTPASGFFRDTPKADPETVTISGPKSKVDLIERVVANVEEEEERSEQKRYLGVALTLYDENDNEIDYEDMGLTFTTETADVVVPIWEIRTIGLTVDFIGMPQGFDSEWLYDRIKLSADELQVVGPSSAFENLANPLPIATFNVSELELNWESSPINIDLSAYPNLSNHDQLKQVTVSFDTTGLVEKTFEVPAGNFRVVNGPANAEITPVPDSISVKVIGTEEQVNALLPEDITIQIDAYDVSASKGFQQTIPARVLIPGADHTFAVGTYSIVCDVTIEN